MDYDKMSETFFGEYASTEHENAAGVKYWKYETDIYLAYHCPKTYVIWNPDE